MGQNTLVFGESLRDAICWCNWVLENGNFESDEHVMQMDRLSPPEWSTQFNFEVERMIRLRRDRLNQIGAAVQRCVNWPGKILIFDPDFTMHDGLAQSGSNGLFDVHGCPLHDFWIGITVDGGAKLFNWIPEPIQESVDRGMKVDGGKCLAWLGEE
jgi:hypothetical protein